MYWFLILIFSSLLFACQPQEKDSLVDEKAIDIDKTPSTTPATQTVALESPSPPSSENTSDEISQEDPSDSKMDKKTEVSSETTQDLTEMDPQAKLLKSLDPKVKVEFAQPDLLVIQEDTVITSQNHKFEISYKTSCLNDSLIAQEMYDYGGTNAISYLISHNYQTQIAIKVDGQLTSDQTIHKNIFQNSMDPEFLDRSIIKHPQFMGFDDEHQEAIFEFIVGIPNTDWLVLAGVNMDKSGKVRIIDVQIPDMAY